jgi:hypothetical protein
MRFEVLTEVRMTMLFFWVVTPCRLVGRCQRYGETSCPQLRWYLPTRLHGVTNQKKNIVT